MKKLLLKQQYVAQIEANVAIANSFFDLQAGSKGVITHIIRKYDDIDGAQFVSEGVKTLLEAAGSSVEELLSHGHTTQSAKHAQAGLLTDLVGKKKTQFEHALPAGDQTNALLQGATFAEVKADAPNIWVTNEEHKLLNSHGRVHWKEAYSAAGIKIYS